MDPTKSPQDVIAKLQEINESLPHEANQLVDEAAAALEVTPFHEAQLIIQHLPNGHPAKPALRTFILVAQGDMQRFLQELEEWFRGAMPQMNTLQKKKMRPLYLFIAGALTIMLNIDSVNLARGLSLNGPVRAAVGGSVTSASDEGVKIGWVDHRISRQAGESHSAWVVNRQREFPPRHEDIPLKVLGWIITTWAVSLGSTYWFNLLAQIQASRRGAKLEAPAGPEP